MVTAPQDSVPSEPSPVKPPSFLRRHKVMIIIILSVACLLTVAVATILTVVNTAFISVRDNCTEKSNRLQATANSIEDRLKNISINGSPPSEVKAWKNGDCLTGTGAVGTASFFKLPYSSVTEADKEAAKSLHAVAPQDSKSFILGDDNGDGLVESIQTRLLDSTNNAVYEVKYYLTDKIACPDHEYGSGTCIHGETSGDKQAYMNKPINKIELSLSMAMSL